MTACFLKQADLDSPSECRFANDHRSLRAAAKAHAYKGSLPRRAFLLDVFEHCNVLDHVLVFPILAT